MSLFSVSNVQVQVTARSMLANDTSALEAGIPVQLFLDDNEFLSSVCTYEYQDIRASAGTYNSESLTSTVDTLGIKYESTPDTFEVNAFDKIMCVSSVLPELQCSAYTRTLTLPSTLPDGSATNGFLMYLVVVDCTIQSTVKVTVKTQSGLTEVPIDCIALRDSIKYALVSTEVIESVAITSSSTDYGIVAVALASTECPPSASPSVAPSTIHSSSPSSFPSGAPSRAPGQAKDNKGAMQNNKGGMGKAQMMSKDKTKTKNVQSSKAMKKIKAQKGK
jgi:hypothetical protein